MLVSTLVVLAFALVAGVADVRAEEADPSQADAGYRLDAPSGPVFEVDGETLIRKAPEPDPNRRAYFGDLHVHTTYSFDAYVFGTLATPYDAYRYARGEAIEHPAGFDVQLRQPLDFYAVTDHAMFLGVMRAAADTSTEFSKWPLAEPLHDLNAPDNRGLLSLGSRLRAFSTFLSGAVTGVRDGTIDREQVLDITRAAWRDTIEAADRFNDPGRFTTFVGYEYTSSTDERGNLHRNVIFAGSEELPAVPFSRFHSQNPEGLWDWMDDLRGRGIESLAIPHNSNGSNGSMFTLEDWSGAAFDESYVERRIRNEPLVEITQVKGTSETHPLLSTEDEWADFEIMPYRVATMEPSDPPGSYVRDALRRGLALESRGVGNPYEFGFIGASDTHTGATSDDESNFFSKIGLLDSNGTLRGSLPIPTGAGWAVRLAAPELHTEVGGRSYLHSATATYGASGLAGVWAEENTRDALYAAFRRKETFATSGPRIRMRFFAGTALTEEMLTADDGVERAYAAGVPMGASLAVEPGDGPNFLVWALADPLSAPLQRLQIVKGWADASGETFEQVYDVACSEGALVDPDTHRCPDNGAGVDLSDCSRSGEAGAPALRALWRDPAFDADQRAFYYARVLENPTCRWSTWDAVRAGVEPRADLPGTLQERAWASPIQMRPGSAR
jgi:hypothetical protein